MTKLGICGFGYTGSGAIFDLLNEFSGVSVVGGEQEFTLAYIPDGLEDLEYHLMMHSAKYFSSDVAIMRFQRYIRKCRYHRGNIYYEITGGQIEAYSEEYVKNISDIIWRGQWMIDPFMLSELRKTIKFRILGRLIPKGTKLYRSVMCRDMHFSIHPSEFYAETEKFLNKVIGYDPAKDGVIVMNQPFPANEPRRSMRLFGKNTKAIIVDRDPRDVYLLAKEYAKPFWMPLDDISDFILYHQKLRSAQTEDENILHIRFEDMIFEYEAARDRIMEFCGLSGEQHIEPFRYFDPKVSLKNTRLFEKTDKYQDEIKAIEEQLPEYLYDFSRYAAIDTAKGDAW